MPPLEALPVDMINDRRFLDNLNNHRLGRAKPSSQSKKTQDAEIIFGALELLVEPLRLLQGYVGRLGRYGHGRHTSGHTLLYGHCGEQHDKADEAFNIKSPVGPAPFAAGMKPIWRVTTRWSPWDCSYSRLLLYRDPGNGDSRDAELGGRARITD